MPESEVLAKINSEASESGACSGFNADTYDRYVLGLLDTQERANIDAHVEKHCPICLKGVQRSMNLWLVFANNLGQMEPSADFRGRLVRIAELSQRVLTVPKRNRRVREPAVLISSLVVICLIATLLFLLAWIAGRQTYRLNVQTEAGVIKDLQNELAETQVTLNQERERSQALEQRLKSSGRTDNTQHLEDQLSRAQAEIQQYKESISRDNQKSSDNQTLVTALTSPGVRLLTFLNAEGVSSTAYAFVIEQSKVIFVASKLPDVSAGHQYQLWLVRKAEPHYVAAGVFPPSDDKDKPVVVTYEGDKEAISGMTGLLVTEEDINGNYISPSSTKVLETPGAAAVAGPAADF